MYPTHVLTYVYILLPPLQTPSFSLCIINCKNDIFTLQVEERVVVDLIMATKSHNTDIHNTPGGLGSDDLHYFLDFDMAILGSNAAGM